MRREPGAALLLPLALGEHSPSNATALTQLGNNNSSSSSTNSTELLPIAEKLIRYRRHPPHSKRSKHRRRNKGPKTKYGPPSYPAEPPINYYKHTPSFPTHHELPGFSLDDFQHLKFDGADFQIPASSYEAQSMDLDLYSHGEPDLYGAHKFPSLEYSIADSHESPPPSLSSYDHKPHQKYGVPPQHQSFDSPSSFVSHHYEPPPAPAHPPSTKYGAPAVSSYKHSASLPAPDSYSIYEHKIPNSGYHHSFAEPPSKPPAHNTNFEISYSPPAYEISTSYQANEPQYEHNYAKPSPGHSYEPPPSSHNSYQPPAPAPGHSYDAPPSSHDSYQPPAPAPGHSYQPPSSSHDSYQPPSSSHDSYQPPGPSPDHSYHPPASSHDSYQPPSQSYHPPTSSHDSYLPPTSSHDSYLPPAPSPPNLGYQPGPSPAHDYQPPQDTHYAEPPPLSLDHAPSYSQPDTHQPAQNYPQENYAPPSEELPLTPNHKFPSFDFPKSSYEVPIYDPIPFEASNKDEQESYPPILPENTPNEVPSDDTHTAGSSRTPTKSRKRKRRPALATVSKKHTLDVPELQEAYDADAHVHARDTDLDTAAHGSRHVEQKRKYVSYVTPSISPTTTTTTTSAPWSPMRVRPTSSNGFIPTVVTSTPPTRSRGRGTSRFRSRNPSTEATSTVVTIEKSRSQSYYDGTIAPPTYQQFTVGRGARPTRPTQLRGGGTTPVLNGGTERNATPRRTTKGIFDTTLFKTPQSDREMERKLLALRQNLPKNHKLY
ncbi:uncharacterized protein Dmoj_GI16822 [Drosophila mojavensis]|uniref:Uncharacterized protein n=1 Tax=Drosophila mojavensis TaxID=7230 RepID=B4L9C4_DROMO|nr:uncharacterized protein Dmoj_GI16822 [Drosophila mojavensis]